MTIPLVVNDEKQALCRARCEVCDPWRANLTEHVHGRRWVRLLQAAIVAGLLSGCASTGLYTMTNEWCSTHPGASPARCDRNPLKEYDVQGHQLAGEKPDLATCPKQYTYGAYGLTITCWGKRG